MVHWPGRARLLLVALLLSAGTASAQELPTDLDLVPRDAAAFVHFRARDLWTSEWLKDVRHLLDRAGPEAWKEYEKRSPIKPESIERVTVVMLSAQTVGNPFPTVDPETVSALVILRTSQPYDRLALLEAVQTREKAYRRQVYHFHEDLWSGLFLVDDRTFIVGSEDALVRWLDATRQRNANGPLAPALRTAAGKHQITLGLNPALFAKEAQGAPEPIVRLLEAQCVTATLSMDKEIALDLRLDYAKVEQAQNGEKAVRDTLEMARQALAQPIAEVERELKGRPGKQPGVGDLPEGFAMLMALGMLREIDGLLKEVPVQRQNTAVLVPIRYRKLESANMLLVSTAAISMIGRSASRFFGEVGQAIGKGKDPMQEYLKTLHQALEKYHADKGSYPPAVLRDSLGRPVMSWRVALLPYLGDEGKTLYSEFRLDEPWDSLHNKRLLKKMPAALKAPGSNNYYYMGNMRHRTQTQVITGTGAAFDGVQGPKKGDLSAKTILLTHGAGDQGVYWTKPFDLVYAADQPLPFFGTFQRPVHVLQHDGSYRTLQPNQDEKELRGLILRQPAK